MEKSKRTIFREKIEKNQCEIISKMAAIDLFVSKLISDYSCKKKQTTIMNYLLKNTSIINKITLIEYILKDSNMLRKKTYPEFIPDLKAVNKIRNKYAHALLLIPVDVDDDKLTYFEFRSFLELNKDERLNVEKKLISSHNGDMIKAVKVLDTLVKLTLKM